MPAVVYANLIRYVRALEDLEQIDREEGGIIRAAADARLLADEDWRDRMLEADGLLAFCEEYERLTTEQVEAIREHLSHIRPPAVAELAARQREARAAEARRNPLVELIRSALGRAGRDEASTPVATEPLPPTPEQIEAARVVEHAERVLAFEAWLDAHGRR